MEPTGLNFISLTWFTRLFDLFKIPLWMENYTTMKSDMCGRGNAHQGAATAAKARLCHYEMAAQPATN
jgi:hypothetical protein